MPWTQGTDGVFRKTGTTRDAVIAKDTLAGIPAVPLQLVTREDEVEILMGVSQDGRSGITGRVTSAAGAKAQIRSVRFGVYASSHAPASADVLVEAAFDSAALAPGVPFSLEMRLVDQRFQLWVNDAMIVEYDNSTHQAWAGYAYWGFASAKDGAQVLTARACGLVPTLRDAGDVLGAIGGGELWISVDGTTISRIDRVVFDPEGDVDGAEFFGAVYLYDGSKALRIDLANLTLSNWVPTSGSLPGQIQLDGNKPGRSTATLVEAHMARILSAGTPTDPQNLFYSAQGDALDHDTGSTSPARAFALNLVQAGKVGHPIRAVFSNGAQLIIGTDRAFFSIVGDPVFNGAVVDRFQGDASSSPAGGRNAISPGPDASVLAWSPHGLLKLQGGSGSNISRSVLTKHLSIPDASLGQYVVLMVRDPARHGTHVFLTARQTSTTMPESTHVWFDERIHASGAGGFFLNTFPPSLGPTAAVLYRGQVVVGTRQGYLCVLDDNTTTDFDSTSPDQAAKIDSKASLALVRDDSSQRDTILERLSITLANGTAATVRVFGGHTSQAAYDIAERQAGPVRTALGGKPMHIQHPFAANAIVVQLESAGKGTTWSLERCEAKTSSRAALQRWAKRPPPAPPAPCGPFVPGSGSGSGSGPGFSGGGGPGQSGFSGSGSYSGPPIVPGGSGSELVID
ncbi:MAG: hypothetical protein SFZ23_08630 [Planctomycetota bacterium]|nr:hypothetical protein [Planctomycetota bacterium]